MRRRRELSEEERALWTGVVGSVTPLRRSKSIVQSEEAGKSAAEAKRASMPGKPRERAPRARLPAEAPPLVALGRRLKQRVARGVDPIDARIDLHGHTQRQAHAALFRFLQRAQADGARTVLVVTGKGAVRGGRDGGGERGVLKRQVPMWLSLPEFRSFVVGFEDAHVGHGGEGALYVRLRRPLRTDR
jgi:DNA-nicking Smr family endonuclease